MRWLWAAVVVVSLGCASILDVGLSRTVSFVPQRTQTDCAIAALAMLLDTSYEAVEGRRVKLGIPIDDGLYAEDAADIAGSFGVRLGVTRVPNPAQDTGIVVIQPTQQQIGYVHAVYLYHAYVYDPADATVPTPYIMAYVKWGHIYYFLKQLPPPTLTDLLVLHAEAP